MLTFDRSGRLQELCDLRGRCQRGRRCKGLVLTFDRSGRVQDLCELRGRWVGVDLLQIWQSSGSV